MNRIPRLRTLLGIVGALFLVHGCAAAEKGKAGRDVDVSIACPVSGAAVSASRTPHVVEYQGETYYFCCGSCKKQFEKDPEKYLAR